MTAFLLNSAITNSKTTAVVNNYKDPQLVSYYTKYRPNIYPVVVYEKILSYLEAGNGNDFKKVDKKYKLAVDVGCGSGQGTLSLCKYFEEVIGVDPSVAQIEEAERKLGQIKVKGQYTNIKYRLGAAEDLSFLPDNSVDLITVACAIHWFDVERFCVESRRVLREDGVLAAFSYDGKKYELNGGQAAPKINEIFFKLYEYGDPRGKRVLDKYDQIFKDFKQFYNRTRRDDSIAMSYKYSFEEIQGFMKSICAYWNMRKSHPNLPDPVETLRDYLLEVYDNSPPEDAVIFASYLFLIMAKK